MRLHSGPRRAKRARRYCESAKGLLRGNRGAKSPGWHVVAVFCVVCAAAAPARAQQPIHWSLTLAGNAHINAGRVFNAELTASLDPTWHLYATTQPAGGPQPLIVTVPKGPTFSLAGEIGSGLPQIAHDPNFNLDTQFFEERAAFTVPIQVAPSTKDGMYRLAVTVSYQTCNDRLCLPPTEEELSLDAVIGRSRSGTATISTLPPSGPRPARPSAPTARVTDMAAASAGAGTLLGYVWLAMAMGALSLLTPCVFPMVP